MNQESKLTRELVLDRKGRIELPEEIRESRHMESGDRIRLEEKADGTLVLHILRDIRELAGMFDSNGIHLTIEEINQVIESKGLVI